MVRQAAVQSLRRIYVDDVFVARLEAFTLRFKNRIFEMTRDVDSDVRLASIDLVNQLLRFDLLTETERKSLVPLVIDEDIQVRRRIAPLVIKQVQLSPFYQERVTAGLRIFYSSSILPRSLIASLPRGRRSIRDQEFSRTDPRMD